MILNVFVTAPCGGLNGLLTARVGASTWKVIVPLSFVSPPAVTVKCPVPLAPYGMVTVNCVPSEFHVNPLSVVVDPPWNVTALVFRNPLP